MKIRDFFATGVVICTLAIGLAGCGGTQMGSSSVGDPNKQAQIQKGVSSKDSILALFGPPNGKDFAENGDEVWSYQYMKSQINPATYVPVVGLFAGGASSEISVLTVTFGKNGIVKAYGTSNSNAASRI